MDRDNESLIEEVRYLKAYNDEISARSSQRPEWLFAARRPKSRTQTLLMFAREAIHWLRAGNQPPSNPIAPYKIPIGMWATLWILLCIGVLAASIGALA